MVPNVSLQVNNLSCRALLVEKFVGRILVFLGDNVEEIRSIGNVTWDEGAGAFVVESDFYNTKSRTNDSPRSHNIDEALLQMMQKATRRLHDETKSEGVTLEREFEWMNPREWFEIYNVSMGMSSIHSLI